MNQLGIIGFGSLGRSLAEALKENDRLAWVLIRNASKHGDAELLKVPIYSELSEIKDRNVSIILAIPDKEIHGISQAIHELFLEEKGYVLIHCSGALTKHVLDREHGLSKSIAMHPFQSVKSAPDLPGTPWGIECDFEERAMMNELIDALNGKPFFLDEQSIQLKSMYHATAVISANFLTMLTALSAELAEKAHIPADFFLPRIQSTVLQRAHTALNNHESILSGLTGPLIRMDEETIRANRKAIRSIPGMDDLYCAMSKAGIQLLIKEKLLTMQQGMRLIEVLHEMPSDE